MSKDFPNECTCDACQCTYIAREGGPKNRCKAHESLAKVEEEKVKYKYRDISNQELANRVETLEHKVEDLMQIIMKEKVTYTKVCEGCGVEFQATAPAVKKCTSCKKGK